jgi:hypothetical protein
MEAARHALCDIVASLGAHIAADPRRLHNLLNDLCPEERKAVFVLTATASTRIASDLFAAQRATALHVERATRRLADELGFAEDVARWAAETWALALGATTDSQHTLLVSPDGRGQFTSLVQALRAAPPWSRIDVLPGLYRAPLVVDRPVEIVAVGRPGEVVIEGDGTAGLRLTAEYALLRGACLRSSPAVEHGPRTLFGVDVPHGELYLEDCDVSGAELACVAVRGRAASATLRRCRVRHGRQAGVYVSLGGACGLSECEIAENGGAGVEIGWQGSPILRRCRITANGTYGIRIYAGGESQVEECDLTGNRLGAWSVEDAA